VLSGVSFEKYTLGDNCQLVTNEALSDVNGAVIASGLDNWPMMSSYPHPPEFMTWMRKVIYSEECGNFFIDQAIREAEENNFVGFNLDWEPVLSNVTAPITEKDATSYASFVSLFSDRLHEHGLKLAVDVATWVTSPGVPSVWNYTALAESSVDKGISMGTYTSNDASFESQLAQLVAAFGTARSGVGLMTVNASSEQPLGVQEVAYRFDLMAQYGIQELDIWNMPIPDNWWGFIEAFAFGTDP
jgi:hypothetical protein